MIFPLYSIRDTRANTFGTPIAAANDHVIMRSWAQQILSGQDQMAQFSPGDFSLFRIGDFDVEKGVVVSKVPILELCTAREVISNYGPQKE